MGSAAKAPEGHNMSLLKLSGKRPATLGADADGLLAQAPKAPKCVSSQADAATDSGHAIAPLALGGQTPQAVIAEAANLLASWPGASVVTTREQYLHAECSTRTMGFVDDLELVAGDGCVHVRSCSRLGYSDWGVNRRRVEQLRRALADA